MTWHLYPENEPKAFGNYLVTLDSIYGNRIVTSAWHIGGRWYTDDKENRFKMHHQLDGSVVAWAELPEPFRRIDDE